MYTGKGRAFFIESCLVTHYCTFSGDTVHKPRYLPAGCDFEARGGQLPMAEELLDMINMRHKSLEVTGVLDDC